MQALETTSDEPLHKHHQLLCEAVREAGEVALAMYRSGVDSWDKSDGTPVSEADLVVDELLARKLRSATPDFGWLSEETAREDVSHATPMVWVVDPIDGTSAFVGGSRQWCVGACLLAHGRPVAAAAFAPAQDRFYDALLGGGARLNGSTISVTGKSGLDGSRFTCY